MFFDKIIHFSKLIVQFFSFYHIDIFSFLFFLLLLVPVENVATIKNSACVIEGVSRSRNALINGDTRQYDWDSGYTCHQLGSGAIVVQLAQPYMISSMRSVSLCIIMVINGFCLPAKYRVVKLQLHLEHLCS